MVRQSSSSECSISSTVTVERAANLKPDVDCSNTPTTTHVGFDMSQNTVHEMPPVSLDELNERWYHTDHYKVFKRSLVDLARQFQHADTLNSDPTSFKALLTKTFHACREVTKDTPSCTCELEENDMNLFKNWMARGSRRGIERACVQEIIADKASRRRRISIVVICSQEAAKHMGPDERAEYLRKVSESVSRPSALFAWYLAM